ncbi:MAG: peptide chain release factor 3 [Thermomicrobia bacterium]|nr:peptide chain release factor 3 [Thermomicrobia bacterium]MCA1722773.1 peptide chain release factor 3 [Thermomicrobia bacterium]
MIQVTCASASEIRLADEIARRRSFAIISHPDAGKTTLTEKLLLYAGAVELAGAVRTRNHQRHATADWMAMEQERGISITSTVLQFEHAGCRFNLLDTPGHQDFSEDTYRTLMAVDSAVMVLDGAKGIEPQTRKLFAVCRMRRLPILTFINKLDHEGCEPLGLLDEIERTLGVRAAPMNWPIGSGATFQGVYDLVEHRVLRFSRTAHNARRAPAVIGGLHDPATAALLGEAAYRRLVEEIDLLAAAGAPFERAAFLAGDSTLVFFGSALNNFGVEPFLTALHELAPPPGPRMSDRGPVAPTDEAFSGFVFKMQANMDPRHRDRMAFLRICSGRFEKDMVVFHPRLGRAVRMARPHRLFARERETVDEAFPGDVVGLINPGALTIGDTLCTGPPLSFAAIPRFPAECFALLHNDVLERHKQFLKGLGQMEEEGVVRVFHSLDRTRREPILGAVGELQFDVVIARLRAEYGVAAHVERLPFAFARRAEGTPQALTGARQTLRGGRWANDRRGDTVAFFTSLREWESWQKQLPGVELRDPV